MARQSRYFTKTSGEIRKIEINWSREIGNLTITGSTWALDVGSDLVIESSVFTDSVANLYLSGGTNGTTYKATNTVTLSDSQRLIDYVLITVIDPYIPEEVS